jgi:hypothetical protein
MPVRTRGMVSLPFQHGTMHFVWLQRPVELQETPEVSTETPAEHYKINLA